MWYSLYVSETTKLAEDHDIRDQRESRLCYNLIICNNGFGNGQKMFSCPMDYYSICDINSKNEMNKKADGLKVQQLKNYTSDPYME